VLVAEQNRELISTLLADLKCFNLIVNQEGEAPAEPWWFGWRLTLPLGCGEASFTMLHFECLAETE